MSLIAELQLLVRAGLTPMQAIQAATSGPARFLGIADSLGTIAQGKIADLLILDRDPLVDIGNAATIRAMFLSGRYLPRAELDQLRSSVREVIGRWESRTAAAPESSARYRAR